MMKDTCNAILYEIASNEKGLNQEQLNIVMLMTKAFKLENEYLKGIESDVLIMSNSNPEVIVT